MPEQGRGFARRVTVENLNVFAPLLRTGEDSGDESTEVSEAAEPPSFDPAMEAALELFEGASIRTFAPRRPRLRLSDLLPPPEEGGFSTGDVVWRKRLVPSDVQSQTGNPTGGVRLTQARFVGSGGDRINQTTYFRNEVFGGLTWNVAKAQPYREDASAEFRVRVRGQDWGVYRLRVSHKPTGEAGQNNYTTMLHWGDLGGRVAGDQLVRALLTLYAPASEGEPFLIDIS